jgi:hypothetical protein
MNTGCQTTVFVACKLIELLALMDGWCDLQADMGV